ncbi:MAG: T9SS type A sorting domain-containing protein, partial [Candidatus Marinimicrobia bacterium]|nr:T9SS type A sorting domain-containing protein [Candidatus Neomarinimicrobiota bacterium]
KEQNQYMWDLRAANLTEAASYYIYAHIAGGTDNLVVQYNADGDWVPAGTDDREFVISHGDDFIAKTPIAGVPVEVYTEDQFDFLWSASNPDPALSAQLVQAFMATKGTVLAATDYVSCAALATADYAWLFPTADNGENSAGVGVGTAPSAGKQTVIFGPDAGGAAEINTEMAGGAIAAGEYDVYYFYSSDGTFSGNETAVKAAGTVYYNGLLREETSLELGPRQATVAIGDTITVNIYAKDTGTDPIMLSLFLDIPSDYFSIIDQVSGTAGTQPIANEAANFIGTVLLNELTTSGSTYQISYIERAAAGDALDASLAVGSFQLVVTANSTSPALLDNLVTWSSSGGRVTAVDNPDGTSQSITYHSPAGNYMLARPGSITGIVDLEGRTDNGQTVAMYIVPKGSMTPITDSDFLSANSDADGTDGIDVTLDEGGTYTLSRVPTGSYDMIVKKDSYISELIEDLDVQPLASTSANFAGADKVLAGDAAGYDHDGLTSTATQPDDEIDATDISAISAAFNTTSGDSLWNAYADIDGDGTVFVADLNLSASNQGKDADDDGDEMPWYKSRYQGNEKALAALVRGNESADGVTYDVELSAMAHLHGYAVEMTINREHWAIVGYEDGFANYYDSYSLSQVKGDYALYAGVILGRDCYRESSMNAMSVTLKAKVSEPEAPSLSAVTMVDAQGAISRAIISSGNVSPTEYSLAQNYPNPFNPVTSIRFSLPEDSNVRVAVYNLLGQEVATLASGAMTAGSYNVAWNALDNSGKKVSSGVYFYRLKVDNNVIATRKMLLLK